LKIEIDFAVERKLGNPKIKIQVGDYDVLCEGDCPDHIEADINLVSGEHYLIITHFGKTIHDHEYDAIGNVIADKHVYIKSIKLDDVELTLEELNSGVFWPIYDFNSDENPASITPNLYLGFNGQWKLQIFYPAIDWLIQSRQNGPNLDGTVFKTSKDVLNSAKDFFDDGDLPEI